MKYKIVDNNSNLITNITLKDFILKSNNWFYKNIHSRIIRAKRDLPEFKQTVLSKRETEVFNLIGSGIGRQVIAHMLNISPKTVDEYKRRIKQKLNLKNDVGIANKLRDRYEKI
jgi:DNA-binding NarL/FixJ family response regulator